MRLAPATLSFAPHATCDESTRHEIFEVAADFMNPPTMIVAMESGKEEEWTAAMEVELQSLW